MPYQFLLYDHKDGIVTLTLNRPDRLNALGDTLREELYDAMSRASDDPEARVIVLTGAGRGFCAGGDMKAAHEVQEGRRERALHDRVAPIRDKVVLAMRDSPKPIIAAVNGPAAGAGMNLALGGCLRINVCDPYEPRKSCGSCVQMHVLGETASAWTATSGLQEA